MSNRRANRTKTAEAPPLGATTSEGIFPGIPGASELHDRAAARPRPESRTHKPESAPADETETRE